MQKIAGRYAQHLLPLGDIQTLRKFQNEIVSEKPPIFNDMTISQRDLLCQWMLDVIIQYDKSKIYCWPEDITTQILPIYWTSISLFYIYVTFNPKVRKIYWQLVGSVCLLLGFKAHGVLMTVDCINEYNDGLYSRNTMCKVERHVLKACHWIMPVFNPLDYITLMLRNSQCGNCKGKIVDVTKYTSFIKRKQLRLQCVMINVCYHNYFSNKYTSFELAASVLFEELFSTNPSLQEVNKRLGDNMYLKDEELDRMRQCVVDFESARWSLLERQAKLGDWNKVVEIGLF